ncbi:DUF551 domain-containing protein [Enterobacter hormaechei]|uniref:DUF551 domain-containing protein n=1 Tax=Enterobacter hormaechei TaxID=158836 RepID=UPI001BD2DB61|nr:DUF551 domain-containing protein [Enterobacter hormaechei]WDC54644.1 DUF551 domain-containing protein [Enterobacter hormaechei]
MSELTKEWLLKTIAELEEERDAVPGVVNEDAAKALEAMKLALASLGVDGDSEPVAFINGAWTLVYYRPPKEHGLKIGDKLLAASPAPVVPDEWEQWIADAVEYLEGGLEADGELEAEGSIEAKRLLSRRAAMLQGANGNSPAHSGYRPAQNCISPAQCGNSPAIPDGWVACSERMPEESGRYWCYVEEQNDLGKSHYQWNCSWNGDRWWVESENGGRVTHWMPLPAAPQQEDK